MSWSVPISVESHLHSLSRKGDGRKRAETGKGVGEDVIVGGIMGALEDSPVFDMVGGGGGEKDVWSFTRRFRKNSQAVNLPLIRRNYRRKRGGREGQELTHQLKRYKQRLISKM